MSPPMPVRLTMHALCLLFQVRPMRVKSPEDGRMLEDYWPVAVRELLINPRLLQDMLNFDKDNIPDTVIKKLSPLLEQDAFLPDTVRKCSIFCEAACAWVRSV